MIDDFDRWNVPTVDPRFYEHGFYRIPQYIEQKSHGPFNLANKALIKYIYLTNLLLTNSSLHRTKIS